MIQAWNHVHSKKNQACFPACFVVRLYLRQAKIFGGSAILGNTFLVASNERASLSLKQIGS